MPKNEAMEFNRKTPVERHATAAWADCENAKEVSGVNLPNEMMVMDAKEYVDENKK